jgi:FMN phosphatase YigB (HAD superfamily)
MKEKIRNIIFDLGGVILNIDISLTTKAFIALADHEPQQLEGLKNERAYLKLEIGKINTGEFCESIRKYYLTPLSDAQIIAAWNAMVLDIPKERLDLLARLNKKYRTFLFSNTNEIHLKYYNSWLERNYGVKDLHPFFEKIYYSHRIGLRKPEQESFEFLMLDSNLVPGETLFVDDTLENIEAAAKLNIQTFHCQPPKGIMDLKELLL